MIISDDDILYAEKMLLPRGKQFDDERRKFIKTHTSCDVVACPGGGKTTALLAKLLILSQKMPFPDGRGICILTHTNVAIGEIKSKLEKQANSLFGYPNFFGTIQSFVDRFLAIPAFFEMRRFRPHAPDDEYYFSQLEKMLSPSSKAYLSNRHGTISENLRKIHLEFNIELGTVTLDLSALKLKTNTSPTFKNINNSCQKLFDDGVLTYGQMYQLADAYIIRHPKICTLFSHRFCYLLVDEMQDTDEKQCSILESLFKRADSCIIQRVGDPNQAIFNSTRNEKIWIPSEPILHFSRSMRFGASIANLLDTVRVDRQILLSGSNDVSSLPPKMITYSDDEISLVLQAFWNLICKHDLHSTKDISHKEFYAVGWRKEHDVTGITHYWPDFKSIKNKESFDNLYTYICSAFSKSDIGNTPQELSRSIWNGLAKFYRIFDNECRFTGRKLHQEFRATYPSEYLLFVQKLSSRISTCINAKSIDIIHRFIINALRQFMDYHDLDLSAKASRFLTERSDHGIHNDNNNICTFGDNCIKISTIHGVKGQTHTATMLMETKYQRSHESEYLHEYLCGIYKEPPSSSVHLQQCLRMAHVAISRPTHLFVMACHQDRVQKHKANLGKAGWVIYGVNDLIN